LAAVASQARENTMPAEKLVLIAIGERDLVRLY
jgi:hypothetical protein